jgi:hypothetical protein
MHQSANEHLEKYGLSDCSLIHFEHHIIIPVKSLS